MHRFCSMPLTNLNSDVSILYILQNSEGDPSWCSLCGFEGSLPILLWVRMQDCSFVSSLTTLVMHIINFMVFLVHLLFFLKHWILYFHWAKLLTVDRLEHWTLGVIRTLVPPGFEGITLEQNLGGVSPVVHWWIGSPGFWTNVLSLSLLSIFLMFFWAMIIG